MPERNYARADIPFLLAEVERLSDALKAKEAVNQAYSAAVDLMDDARRELHEKLVTVAADRDRWEQAAESQNNRIDVLESDAAMHRHHAEIVTADRDRWKARADEYYAVSQLHEKRAEALERAIKLLPHRATNAACHICRHQAKPDKFMCENPGGGCQNGDYVGWQFDEARFAGGGEQP